MLNSIKYLFILLITLSFFSCDSDNTSIISPPANDTKPVWPQVGYNGRHTGSRYGINVNIPPVQTGNVYWMDTVTTAWVNDGCESACDASGNFYFRYSRSSFGQVIKYRPDGTKIWERDSLKNDCYHGFALSNDETRIYYNDWYKFTCRDSSGNLVWSIQEGNYFGVIPCVAKDGTIYTSMGFDLTAVSPDGNIKWRLYETNLSTCWLALDRYDNIYVCNKSSSGQFELIKVDGNGNITMRYELSEFVYSVVIDGFNNVYFRDSQKLASIDDKGEKRWVKVIPGIYCYVPAITKNNHLIIDSSNGFIMSIDNLGVTDWVVSFPNQGSIEPYIILDDEDNVYYNHWYNGNLMAVSSLDKYGYLRWQSIEPAIGWILPGLTLSPLGMLFDTPKRPNVVFTIK